MIQEEILFEESQNDSRDGHLGYGNRTILAKLKLHVVLMPLTKFWFNLTYDSERDVV